MWVEVAVMLVRGLRGTRSPLGRGRRYVLLFIALGSAIALVVTAASGSGQGESPAISVPRGSTIQPATLLWEGSSSRAATYASPGAMVVAGRDNFADPVFKEISEAGGSVLIYIDPVIDNAYGRYHQLLLEPSDCGPAAVPWPGSPAANSWGDLIDFRPNSVVQQKLRCVLEKMVVENPHMAGWFLDDVGSRSWFPRIDWEAWTPRMQRAYRQGAIDLTRTMRDVADKHGLIFLVNGTWTAGPQRSDGGGFPDPQRHGNALADGGFVENHDQEADFFVPYACSRQWAALSSVTRGEAVHYATNRTWAGVQAYAQSRCFSYVNRQETYAYAPPWGPFHDLGLPTGTSKRGGPAGDD